MRELKLYSVGIMRYQVKSHPLRVRELKPVFCRYNALPGKSHPLRVRELKLYVMYIAVSMDRSHPLRVRELKQHHQH